MAESEQRCSWCLGDPEYIRYHDKEWGVPCFDERQLFECLILECAQAGLNWLTVLKKRDNYRKAFFDFDVAAVAAMDASDVERLMNDSGIIRHRKKIESTVTNAQAFIRVQREYSSFSEFLWSLVGHKPVCNSWERIDDVPTSTELSVQLGRLLRQRGFSFVGSTICYAYMQATGLVNDHLVSCPAYRHCIVS